MKRGIISITLALILALCPVESVAAAVSPAEGIFFSATGTVADPAEDLIEDGEELPEDEPKDEPEDEPKDEPGDEPKDNPEDEPKDNPEDEPEDEPGDEPKDEPGDEPKDEPEDEPKDEPGDEPKDEPEDEPKDVTEDEPGDEPGDEPKDNPEDEPKDEPEDEPKDEPGDEPKDVPEDEPKDEPGDNPEDKKDDIEPDEETEEEPEDEPVVSTYKIVFDGNGATSGTMDAKDYEWEKSYTLPANAFIKTGYVFTAWNTKPDGTGTSYKDKASVTDLVPKPGSTKEDKSSKSDRKEKTDKESGTDRKENTGKESGTDKKNKTAAGEDVSVTLYAQWKETPYRVTYILNGGTNNTANPNSYTITTDTIILKDPVKRYSVFEGWFADVKFSTKAGSIPKGSTGEKKFYAKWREYTYTINYDGNGATKGSIKPQAGIGYSKAYTLKANKYKRKGYVFNSWNLKKKGTGTKFKDKATVQGLSAKDGGEVTLYAQWKEENYKIKYHLRGGRNNSANPKKYTIKTKTITLKDPKRKGYTFLGWYKDKAGKKKVTKIKKGSTGTINLYAKWKVNRYTVEYVGNGATGGSMRKTVCKYGKEYKLRANKFRRTGYTFKNWNRKKKGTGTKFADAASISNLSIKDGKVVRLYAQWKPIKYKVKFHGNGSDSGSMSVIKCTYDKEFKLPKNKFKRDGYNFRGWSTEDDGSGDHYDDRDRVKNLTDEEGDVVNLYARWEYDSDEDDATIWNFLSEKIGNDYGAAGVIGNLYAESGLRSNNLENMYNERFGLSDDEYTSMVDNGEYGNFGYDHAGYGIAQWTFPSRKQGLLEFARDMGTSISNLRTQLEYLWKELSETYTGLLDALRSAGSVREASDAFMRIFENPADQSEGAKQRRAEFGWRYFLKFH